MAGELFRITHTKAQSFDQCRKQYWFRYVSRLPAPPKRESPPGMMGTGVHQALKVLCDTGESARGAEALDTYLRMPLHEQLAPGTEYNALAFQLFAAGCAAHASIESEDRWAEISTWAPWPSRGINLMARIDRADRLSPGVYQLIDWKTGTWGQDETNDAQLDIGHVGLRIHRQMQDNDTVLAVCWNLRTGERRERALRRDDAKATMAKMAALALRIQAEAAFEPSPGPACTFCDWQNQCPAGGVTWEE